MYVCVYYHLYLSMSISLCIFIPAVDTPSYSSTKNWQNMEPVCLVKTVKIFGGSKVKMYYVKDD